MARRTPRRMTLRQAAEVLGCHPTTVWRQHRRSLVWGRHEGHRCWLIDMRLVRAAVLPRSDDENAEVVQAKLEVISEYLEELGKRLVQLERATKAGR